MRPDAMPVDANPREAERMRLGFEHALARLKEAPQLNPNGEYGLMENRVLQWYRSTWDEHAGSTFRQSQACELGEMQRRASQLCSSVLN